MLRRPGVLNRQPPCCAGRGRPCFWLAAGPARPSVYGPAGGGEVFTRAVAALGQFVPRVVVELAGRGRWPFARATGCRWVGPRVRLRVCALRVARCALVRARARPPCRSLNID
eukprot:352131-Chlamydomonas_euryale.AAC.1